MPADTPRRILYVDHTARLGGGEIALFNLVTHLDRGRYVPTVVLFEEGPLADRLRAAGVETHVLAAGAAVNDVRKDDVGVSVLGRAKTVAGVTRQIARLTRFIRKGCYDLVHCNSLKADVIGGIAGRAARRRVLWHVHDRISADYLPARTAAAFRTACSYLPHAVVVNSHATLATLPTTVDPSVVYCGVDRRLLDLPHAARRELTFGIVGRLAEWKGQHVFLAAAARVREAVPDARFRVVGAALFGEDDYERRLRDDVGRLGLTDCVRFDGFRSDMADVLADLDVLVHASVTPEPFGQVVVEAMAAGRPVVATDGGGVRETVVHDTTGLLVPMGNADVTAAAMIRLACDPDLRLRMGSAGRQRVLEHFTIDKTASDMRAVYDKLLA